MTLPLPAHHPLPLAPLPAPAPKQWDYQDHLDYAWNLRERARLGIKTEKLGGGGGIIKLTETHPMLELQATRLMIDIMQVMDGSSSEPIALDIRITEAVDIP
jgi:hypothetical protein